MTLVPAGESFAATCWRWTRARWPERRPWQRCTAPAIDAARVFDNREPGGGGTYVTTRSEMHLRRLLVRVGAIVVMTVALVARATAQDEFASDAARLAAALELTAGQTVADVGAGDGELTVALARAVGPSGRVYGTEVNADRLRAIRQAADSAGLTNVAVVEGQATRTNLPERCCDALVVRFVYHHFSDPRLMNASLCHSLRPGGRLAVLDFPPDGAESADPAGRGNGEWHGVTAATVMRELRRAGFEVVSVEEGTRTSGFMVVARRPAG